MMSELPPAHSLPTHTYMTMSKSIVALLVTIRVVVVVVAAYLMED